MAYRNITVDGVDYQYTVGKQFTKIKGIGAVKNTFLGARIDENRVAVTPDAIAQYIRTGTVIHKPAVTEKTHAEMAAAKMRQIGKDYQGDPEALHGYGDDLLCNTLRELGYGEMVDEFDTFTKWYA